MGVKKWPSREFYHLVGLMPAGVRLHLKPSKVVLLTLCCVLGSPVEWV